MFTANLLLAAASFSLHAVCPIFSVGYSHEQAALQATLFADTAFSTGVVYPVMQLCTCSFISGDATSVVCGYADSRAESPFQFLSGLENKHPLASSSSSVSGSSIDLQQFLPCARFTEEVRLN